GMTGIIINDAIVLVMAVDDYSENRGLVPAIIDATADRLRPVMLTTLTTVLGLSPLLFERSQDAQFLKPTVITLVYGLGFGMVLVLLVVPAVLAMQQDIGKQFRALRRAVGGALSGARRARLVGGLTVLAGLFAAALFWATLGSVITTGALMPALVQALPVQLPTGSMAVAAGLFLGGVAAVTLLLFLLGSLGFALRRRV
ncbi:MAG: efflux RND transporter permease subunit, partial [Paracoccaceae bacterium]